MCVEWCKPSCVDAPYVNRRAWLLLKVCSYMCVTVHFGSYLSLDIQDHFFHAALDRRCWKQFVLDLGPPLDGPASVQNPRFVYCVAMPMGYTNSPAVMARIMAGIVKRCRSEGIWLIHYADDWLIMAATKAECARHRALAVRRRLSAPSVGPAPGRAQLAGWQAGCLAACCWLLLSRCWPEFRYLCVCLTGASQI
eukprot:COSAG01_NODE_30850_length_608_cov_1.210216_1_plen_194_part_01